MQLNIAQGTRQPPQKSYLASAEVKKLVWDGSGGRAEVGSDWKAVLTREPIRIKDRFNVRHGVDGA